MVRSLSALKRRTKAASVPVIYVNDNFSRWRSDFRKLVEHCLNAHVRGQPVIAQLRLGDDHYPTLLEQIERSGDKFARATVDRL